MSEVFTAWGLSEREKYHLRGKFLKKVFRYDDDDLCHLWPDLLLGMGMGTFRSYCGARVANLRLTGYRSS